ncbi:GNAT family N-acetyltransferase [Neobacillus kokaensis]|uniref:N-acetyltransferase n=1 Tax=Neobacillus kokaensis TaxID=2759023 RepID=A0ABQ3N395_9BACI|nr:GNAT family N-acetyltransferase [Neobacillus kokaensis]GHH99413.1 N-acetyltransferase [Neobacillus kokaensis]
MSFMMYSNKLQQLSPLPLPAGYSFRTFQPGDETIWANIETRAGEFANEEAALQRFRTEFLEFESDLQQRCFFLENAEGEAIGTIMAWFGEYGDRRMGRIHWVAIIPEYQGRKLAKPMVTYALSELKKYHQEAYLTTQEHNDRAIRLYEKYGFIAVERLNEDGE